MYREFALPYFERATAPCGRSITRLNDDPGSSTNQRGLQWYRCSTGIIVAKLLARPNFEELAAFYLDVMKRDNKGFYLKYFQSLLKSLGDVEPLPEEEVARLTVKRFSSARRKSDG